MFSRPLKPGRWGWVRFRSGLDRGRRRIFPLPGLELRALGRTSCNQSVSLLYFVPAFRVLSCLRRKSLQLFGPVTLRSWRNLRGTQQVRIFRIRPSSLWSRYTCHWSVNCADFCCKKQGQPRHPADSLGLVHRVSPHRALPALPDPQCTIPTDRFVHPRRYFCRTSVRSCFPPSVWKSTWNICP
jgi:hypothetical protein